MAKHPLNEAGYSLGFSPRLLLLVSAGNDWVSAATTLAGGRLNQNWYKFQAMQNEVNANLMRLDAQDIIRRGDDEINRVREEGAKVRGEQRATMSASGFDVDSESYKAVIGETDRNIQRNVAAIRREAMTQYASMVTQARMSDIQAQYQRKAGKIERKRATRDAILGALSGAAKTWSSYYFRNEEGVLNVTKRDKQGDNIRFGDYYYG